MSIFAEALDGFRRGLAVDIDFANTREEVTLFTEGLRGRRAISSDKSSTLLFLPSIRGEIISLTGPMETAGEKVGQIATRYSKACSFYDFER